MPETKKSCFNELPNEGIQLWYIYDLLWQILNGGGESGCIRIQGCDDEEVTPVPVTFDAESCLSIQGCETQEFPVQVVLSPDGGEEEAVVITVVTNDATVPAGHRRVTFISSSDYTGTLQGAVWQPSLAVTFPAQDGNTVGSIAYTTTTGSFTIITVG